MSPTPEELELGAKAYQRVRMCEVSAGLSARRDRWLIACFGIVMLLWLRAEDFHFSRRALEFAWLLPFFIWFGWAINRINKESYANQKLILRLLEEKYGEVLPWVVEEKQMADARELEAKIAQGQPPVSHA